jgi:hypothetical protein
MKERTKQRGPGEVKPGWTTSEFWQTLLIHVIAAVVALGTVFHTHFNLNGLQAVVPAVALVASAVAQSVYSHSRATVKSSAQAAGAHVRSAETTTAHGWAVGAESAPITVRLTGTQPSPSANGDMDRSVAGMTADPPPGGAPSSARPHGPDTELGQDQA